MQQFSNAAFTIFFIFLISGKKTRSDIVPNTNISNWYDSTGRIVGMLGENWVPITQSESLNYYTANEVCFLTGVEQCDYEPGNLKECQANTGRGCRSLSGYFQKHRSTKPWPESKGIADLVKLMHHRGSNTVFVVGDSVSQEFWEDAVCTATRASFETSRLSSHPFPGIKDSFVIKPSPVMIEGTSLGESPYFQVHFISMGRIDNVTAFMPELKQHIDAQLTNPKYTRGKAVFIINSGLHYQREHHSSLVVEYTEVLKAFLPLFVAYAADKHTVMYRETSAQHFHTSTGAFNKDLLDEHRPRKDDVSFVTTVASKIFPDVARSNVKGNTTIISSLTYPNIDFQCSPIKNMTMLEAQNWQNPRAQKILKELDPSGLIGWVPFFSVTAARHDLHVAHAHDCTHFCTGPLLWASVWDAMVRFYESK